MSFSFVLRSASCGWLCCRAAARRPVRSRRLSRSTATSAPVARALVSAYVGSVAEQQWKPLSAGAAGAHPCELTASGPLVTAASWHVHSDGRRLHDAPSSSSIAAAGVSTVRSDGTAGAPHGVSLCWIRSATAASWHVHVAGWRACRLGRASAILIVSHRCLRGTCSAAVLVS